MTAMAPISVRAEGEKGSMGNLVSAMIVGLGTHIASPLERLAYVHREAENSKAMTHAVGARTLAEYSKLMPSALAGLGARLYTRLGLANQTSQMSNCVVTNVPGPRVPIYMAGARMVVQYGIGPIFDGMGLIHPVYSYGDKMTVSFVADRDTMPDPAFYAECIRSSFEDLRKAAVDAKQPTTDAVIDKNNGGARLAARASDARPPKAAEAPARERTASPAPPLNHEAAAANEAQANNVREHGAGGSDAIQEGTSGRQKSVS